MVFAGILAGGKGERMNNVLPKQFIAVKGKPILYYCLQAFCETSQINEIVLACHKKYLDLANQIVSSLPIPDKVRVIGGGETRHDSLVNIILHIKKRGFAANSKIILHEAARPLIDKELITEHINALAHYEATNTLFGAVDTMMVSENGQFISAVPPKSDIYHGQNPQGYDLAKLIHVLENEVTDDDLKKGVDLCGIYLRCMRKVRIIKGNERLFKVTYDRDIELLRWYLQRENQLF